MKKTRISAFCLSAALALALTACGGPAAETPRPALSAQPAPSAAPGETVAVDTAGCFIKLSEFDPEADQTVTAQVTNRTQEPILVTLRSAAVNGVQVETDFSMEVPGGETETGKVELDDPVLEQIGVTEYTDIELNFLAVDADDLTMELDSNSFVHLYPYGAARAERYVRDGKDDEPVFENEYIKIAAVSCVQDRLTGFAANLYLENKTALPLNIMVENATLNGHVCDPFFFTQVAPGKQMFTSIYWSPAFMKESGVDKLFLAQGETDEPEEEVEEIQFHLRVYDDTGWSKADFVDEEIVLRTAKEDAQESPAPSQTPAP